VKKPYWCYKHRRNCSPVKESAKFLRRYTEDTVRRIRAFATLRSDATVEVFHADSRHIELPTEVSGIITSPPYPGLIDYHEQHRYAYELLDLPDQRDLEIGPADWGVSRRALDSYVEGIAATFRNATRFTKPGAPVVIVVNDSRNLYPRILEESGLVLEERLKRHVNRRTGRRAGEFFEDVLVCRTA
jgi:DNA modification methylase